MRNVIDESHIIETAIERMTQEITRMAYWTKEYLKHNVEQSAKDFKDIRNRYNTAKDTLQYRCLCTNR